MQFAANSIRRFHEDQMPGAMWLHEIRPGALSEIASGLYPLSPATCPAVREPSRAWR
jgi:histidinol dehydrogenase